MPAGYSGTPLARKLGIKGDARVAIRNAPAHFVALLDPLPAGVRIMADPDRSHEQVGRFDVVVSFMADRDALDRGFDRARRLMANDGGLWLAWPKKSSSLHRDLAREAVREAGLAAGLVDNKVCAIDEDWSGLRFVYRVEDRG